MCPLDHGTQLTQLGCETLGWTRLHTCGHCCIDQATVKLLKFPGRCGTTTQYIKQCDANHLGVHRVAGLANAGRTAWLWIRSTSRRRNFHTRNFTGIFLRENNVCIRISIILSSHLKKMLQTIHSTVTLALENFDTTMLRMVLAIGCEDLTSVTQWGEPGEQVRATE